MKGSKDVDNTDRPTYRPTDSCKTICPLFQGGHKKRTGSLKRIILYYLHRVHVVAKLIDKYRFSLNFHNLAVHARLSTVKKIYVMQICYNSVLRGEGGFFMQFT